MATRDGQENLGDLALQTPGAGGLTSQEQPGVGIPGITGLAVGPGLVFRMRAFDGTLGRLVFWDALGSADPTGAQYGGPGPLTGTVIQIILGSPT